MNGYIEGYYGKILTWSNRKRIINKLQSCNMNLYFYAPKEDIKHRAKWRNKYGKDWRNAFKDFTKFCNQKNIRVIAGISPGLDFNFNHLYLDSNRYKENDFEILIRKCEQLLDDGANEIAILLDDISETFQNNYKLEKSEGFYHSLLINKVSEELKKSIFFVPRVYANELIYTETNYLKDLMKNINADIKIFYCGMNVVSKTIKYSHFNYLKSKKNNEIFIWDNFYANDYCPRRIFLTPWTGRDKIKNILVNLTGLIETDLFLLDLIFFSDTSDLKTKPLEKVIAIHKIPRQFIDISNFFSRPHCNDDNKLKLIKIKKKSVRSIDHLLWKWKSNLAMEWYPFLMSLKHDLLIYKNLLDEDRIKKTQTNPLAHFLLKR